MRHHATCPSTLSTYLYIQGYVKEWTLHRNQSILLHMDSWEFEWSLAGMRSRVWSRNVSVVIALKTSKTHEDKLEKLQLRLTGGGGETERNRQRNRRGNNWKLSLDHQFLAVYVSPQSRRRIREWRSRWMVLLKTIRNWWPRWKLLLSHSRTLFKA